jgi:hypothetical protein
MSKNHAQTPQQQLHQQQTTRHPNKRVTMIKHIVGKVRTTSYALPDDHDPTYTYGIANKIDAENAGTVVQSWAQSLPPKQETVYIRYFPATNRKALQNGCLTSKSQREYAVHKPVMKVLTKTKHTSSARKSSLESSSVENVNGGAVNSSDSDGQVFGIKSLKNDLPFKELLQNGGDFQEKDYPNLSKRQKRGRIPPLKVTKASQLLEASIKKTSGAAQQGGSAEQQKDSFKMKKFLRVESKVKAMLQVN